MDECKIIVAHYDDRGDPYPPNNYRPEIIIGDSDLLDIRAYRSGHNGCMPKKEAIKIAKKWSKITGIKFEE